MQGHRGFTLIELMVGIAIMAILLAIAIPSFSETIQRNRAEMASDAFLRVAAAARSNAVQDGRRTTLMVGGSHADCGGDIAWAIVRDTTALSCLSLADFTKRFGGVSLSGNALTLEFSANGIGTNTSEPVFSFSSANKTIRVRINAGGTVQII